MKIAICLSGAVSKISGRFLTENSLYNNSVYVNIDACYNSTVNHLIKTNSNWEFDFFIHSWNVDLQDKLLQLYNPKKYLFENNSVYSEEINRKISNSEDFGGVSRSLSIKKSIDLLEEYQNDYDLIMIYRPDILLMKDINLDFYQKDKIYVNGHPECQGDFHFFMNNKNLQEFKNLYFSLEKGNFHKTHFWIKNYVNNFMKQELIMDNIIPGLDQEVLRKINSTTIDGFKIDINKLLFYGLTKSEIDTY